MKGRWLPWVSIGILSMAVGTLAFWRLKSPSQQSGQPQASSAAASGITNPPLAALSPEQRRLAYESRVAVLSEQRARTQALVDRFPKAILEVDALGQTLATADAAFAFVRDRIALEPYPGVMKGASGTLMSRGGNAIDRALLLAAILEKNGISSRIARGQLPDSQAAALLEQISRTPDAVDQMARTLPKLQPAADMADQARLAASSLQSEAEAQARTRRDQIEVNARLLKSSLEQAGVQVSRDNRRLQLDALKDHFWVQASIGGQQVDLDPSFGSAAPNQRFAEPAEMFDPDVLPPVLYQRVGIHAVADMLENGIVTSREVVKADARAVDLVNNNIRVAVEPQALARGQNAYEVTVTLGTAASVTGPFELRSASAAGPAGGAAGGMLGGLGGEEEPPPPSPQNPAGAVLGRLTIEIVASSPQLGDVRYRRVVLDRLDGDPQSSHLLAGMEDDDSIRVLLVQVWDGAISVGASHPLQMFVRHVQTLASQQASTEQALAATYLGRTTSPEPLGQPEAPRQLIEYFVYSTLVHHLIAAAEAPRLRLYVLRPQLAFYRHGGVVDDWSKPGGLRRMQDSIDLINLPFAFAGPRADAGSVGLKFGVADTSLERAFVSQSADFNTVSLVESARAQKIPAVTITQAQPNALDTLAVPIAIKRVLGEELSAGRTLVAPTGLVAVSNVNTFGWWSIDGESGIPLGQMELGGGQAVTEDVILRKKVMTGSHTFSKFYGGLLGCFFVEAADQLVPPDGPYQVTPTFNWSKRHLVPGLPTIDGGGKGLAECIVERMCEAVVELAFLAAESSSFAGDLTHMQEELVEWLGLIGPTAVSNWMHGCTE